MAAGLLYTGGAAQACLNNWGIHVIATNIAIACQGGGSHAAYAAGVLLTMLPEFRNAELARMPNRDVLDETRDRELLNLVGISGTSGGAITALLAWYGFLTGGPMAVADKLNAFWDSNCAQWLGERLWNDSAVALAESVNYDIKLSPYLWPLRELETMTTQVWPAIAKCMGSFNYWMRDNFFELNELIRPHVDFKLVSALGDFCSIPAEVRRWIEIELEASCYGAGAPRQAELRDARHRIQERIKHKLAAASRIDDWMIANRVPGDTLLGAAFDRWTAPAYRADAGALKRLSDAVLTVTSAIPQLLIGAVEIDSSRCTAFSSERSAADSGISLGAVLASASLPWLFQAQRLRQTDYEQNRDEMHLYWDGLFSQNPPIKNFISGVIDKSKKPDGIWVVQINPEDFNVDAGRARTSADALTGSEIWHTRDALSGNLSLRQEVSFIEAVNKRIQEDGGGMGGCDKHIEVHRIVMDRHAVESALGRKLGAFSKFDRDPYLKAALVAHGKMQASTFLSVRSALDSVSGNFGAMLRQLSAPSAGVQETPADALRVIEDGLGAGNARLIVYGMTLHRQPQARGAAEPQVRVHWKMHGASVDGSRARVEGTTGLFAAGGVGTTWRIFEIGSPSPGGSADIRTPPQHNAASHA